MKIVFKSIGMFILGWLGSVIILHIVASSFIHIAWRSYISVIVGVALAVLPFRWDKKKKKQAEAEAGFEYEITEKDNNDFDDQNQN